MQENEDVGSEQSAPAGDESVVYQSFLAAGLDHRRAFRTTQAIRGLGVQNISEVLELHLEKLDLNLDAMKAEVKSDLGALSSKPDTLLNRMDRLIIRMDRLIIRADALISELRIHRWLYCVTILLLAILVALKMMKVFQN